MKRSGSEEDLGFPVTRFGIFHSFDFRSQIDFLKVLAHLSLLLDLHLDLSLLSLCLLVFWF
jgi:hypothetical protein